MRLVGADRGMARRIAAGEVLAGAVAGLALGGARLRRRCGRWSSTSSCGASPCSPRTSLRRRPSSSSSRSRVPALAVVTALVALRGVVIEPLGVVRRATPRRRRLLWRLAAPVVALALLVPLAGTVDPTDDLDPGVPARGRHGAAARRRRRAPALARRGARAAARRGRLGRVAARRPAAAGGERRGRPRGRRARRGGGRRDRAAVAVRRRGARDLVGGAAPAGASGGRRDAPAGRRRRADRRAARARRRAPPCSRPSARRSSSARGGDRRRRRRAGRRRLRRAAGVRPHRRLPRRRRRSWPRAGTRRSGAVARPGARVLVDGERRVRWRLPARPAPGARAARSGRARAAGGVRDARPRRASACVGATWSNPYLAFDPRVPDAIEHARNAVAAIDPTLPVGTIGERHDAVRAADDPLLAPRRRGGRARR